MINRIKDKLDKKIKSAGFIDDRAYEDGYMVHYAVINAIMNQFEKEKIDIEEYWDDYEEQRSSFMFEISRYLESKYSYIETDEGDVFFLKKYPILSIEEFDSFFIK